MHWRRVSLAESGHHRVQLVMDPVGIETKDERRLLGLQMEREDDRLRIVIFLAIHPLRCRLSGTCIMTRVKSASETIFFPLQGTRRTAESRCPIHGAVVLNW